MLAAVVWEVGCACKGVTMDPADPDFKSERTQGELGLLSDWL